jgi:leucyl aminopeptidase
MEENISKILNEHPSFSSKVVNKEVLKSEDLLRNNMNLFYNVGKGAVSEPRCIIYNYRGNPNSNEVDYAFVGKGLTYDTGGLNLKPTGFMEDMFLDKSGACAVFGSLLATL